MIGEAVMGGEHVQADVLGDVFRRLSARESMSLNEQIEARDVLVEELLRNEWTDDYLKELKASRDGFISLREQIEKKRPTGEISVRQELSSWWNGVVGEAVVRRLWEQTTGASMGSNLEMDKTQKTDALGRINVDGREYAFLAQAKATVNMHREELVFVYPKSEKTLYFKAESDDEYENADVDKVIAKIDRDGTLGRLREVADGAKYKNLEIDETVPVLIVVGTGGEWMGLMQAVSEGKLDRPFKQGLRGGLVSNVSK